ncbi:hypothetical protein BG011_000608 [Mortierella polycephala]|uniref:Uncharacterized protein n=1 Tax=Mortierella polycephala TaxID=41804 RepID=A0A9P6Q9K4_9FUNG|nr:hypothetical protein BG011_000608 [Mortierella polycephala]
MPWQAKAKAEPILSQDNSPSMEKALKLSPLHISAWSTNALCRIDVQLAAQSYERVPSVRFNHLDMLSIGEDHVFIIHRQLLLQDIHDYLSGSATGLQRVFVNVDYHLIQPEIMPGNRYKALEDYIREVLLPDVQCRIQSWDRAEQTYRPLAVPNRLSLVTLTGWLLSYPINYVLPGHGRRYSSGGSRPTTERGLSTDSDVVHSYDDEEDEEDEDQDNGRNALANQALVVTRVQLEPSKKIEGLREHVLLSFSYPSDLAERSMDRSTPSPPSPLSPVVERDGYRFETASASASTTSLASTSTSTSTSSSSGDRSFVNGDSSLSPQLPSSASFDQNRPLPFSNPDIGAAGRSFLTQLHNRFQKQNLWKTWQVGQQTVILPVVAM